MLKLNLNRVCCILTDMAALDALGGTVFSPSGLGC